jgi:hypothetical protein
MNAEVLLECDHAQRILLDEWARIMLPVFDEGSRRLAGKFGDAAISPAARLFT